MPRMFVPLAAADYLNIVGKFILSRKNRAYEEQQNKEAGL